MSIKLTSRPFGQTARGEAVTLWRAETDQLILEVMDYGATIRSLLVKTASGEWVDVALGYDTLTEYEQNDGYLGATIGRFCNRIAGAEFELNGVRYPLFKNDGANHLHGGERGFNCRIWTAEALDDGIRFSRVSPDGEEGYPGTMTVSIAFHLSGRALTLSYDAKSDRDTLCNLTNHVYLNLNGSGTILDHTLQVSAEQVLESGADHIPSGRLLDVAGTKFDFRTAKPIGRDLPGTDAETLAVAGYDDNFCLSREHTMHPAAVLHGDKSGLTLTVETTQPGIQVYIGCCLTPRTGKGGAQYAQGHSICLETQTYPDAIHHPDFPTAVLRAGEAFHEDTVFTFA